MAVLITGGCGFLGTNIASQLLKSGEKVIIYDNLIRLGADQNLSWLRALGDFIFVQKDIRSADDVLDVVRAYRPKTIFHLAGQVAMTTSIQNPRVDFDVNTLGTLNVLEAVRLTSAESTIVYSSTNKVYGDLEWVVYHEQDTRYIAEGFPLGFSEAIHLDFHSPYGCSKGAADQYMLDYARVFGLKTIVFRHSSMYGGRQFSSYDQGWIGWFCQKALEAKTGAPPFTISGTGKQVRDVLHADDMVALYLLAAQQRDRLTGQAFNIGGGMENSLSLLELFSVLEEKVGTHLHYTNLPFRESDQKVFVADLAKIRSAIGWEPKVAPSHGIERQIKWCESLP